MLRKNSGAQVAVADDGLLDHAQMGVDELDDLVLWADLLVGHFVQLVRQSLQLRLDDGGIDVVLALEIGI